MQIIVSLHKYVTEPTAANFTIRMENVLEM